MPTNDRPLHSPRSRSRALRVFLTVFAAIMVLSIVIFLGLGRWLVAEDPLVKGNAIMVLSGGMPLRAMEAAKLYNQGYAPQIWLTHSSGPGEMLEKMGISYVGEEVYNTRVLIHEGVPAQAIHLLEPPIENTVDEIRVAEAALRQDKKAVVIFVTTKVHTRRTRLLWRKLTSGQAQAVVRATTADPFDPAHWWRNTADVLDVTREVLGLINAWGGLPLHHSR